MTFTYDLTTDIGKIRFEIGDNTASKGVRPEGANFTDEELQAIFTAEGTVMRSVIRLMDTLSREWARVADITLGPRKESYSQISSRYAKLAESTRDAAGSGSAGTNLRFNRRDGYRQAWELDHGGPYSGEYG